MLKFCILLAVAITATAFPAIQFEDDGFRPIAPPPDAIYRRGRDLKEEKTVEEPKTDNEDKDLDKRDIPISNDYSGGNSGFGGDIHGGGGSGTLGADYLASGGGFGETLGKNADPYSSGSGGGGHGGGGHGGGGHGGGGHGGGGHGGGGHGGGGHGGGGHGGGGHGGGSHGGAGPIKTIYVNVPSDPVDYTPAKPIVAGPPRKHYRIVFIKSPTPPPPPQPILPPRVEQKTLIYVLHPKANLEGPQVVEFPDPVQHDPEVYFIRYDKEAPTADELQGLVKNSLHGGYAPSGLNLADGIKGIPQLGGKSHRQSAIPTFKSTGNKGFQGPSIASGYSSSINQGATGARYSRTANKSQPEIKFEGPFSQDRYERSSVAKPTVHQTPSFGNKGSRGSSFGIAQKAAARGLIGSN